MIERWDGTMGTDNANNMTNTVLDSRRLLIATIIFSDNQSAITIAHHPEFHARTKHINIALHFLRDHVNKGTIDMFYIKTNYNIADIFTKALTRPVHQNFTYELGIIPVKGEC